MSARRTWRQGGEADIRSSAPQAFSARRSLVARGSGPAFDRKHLDGGRAAAQLSLSKRFNDKAWLKPDAVKQVGRDKQIPAGLLAILLQPRGDVHRIAEIGKLAVRTAAFADGHGTGMQPSPKTRHQS